MITPEHEASLLESLFQIEVFVYFIPPYLKEEDVATI